MRKINGVGIDDGLEPGRHLVNCVAGLGGVAVRLGRSADLQRHGEDIVGRYSPAEHLGGVPSGSGRSRVALSRKDVEAGLELVGDAEGAKRAIDGRRVDSAPVYGDLQAGEHVPDRASGGRGSCRSEVIVIVRPGRRARVSEQSRGAGTRDRDACPGSGGRRSQGKVVRSVLACGNFAIEGNIGSNKCVQCIDNILGASGHVVRPRSDGQQHGTGTEVDIEGACPRGGADSLRRGVGNRAGVERDALQCHRIDVASVDCARG